MGKFVSMECENCGGKLRHVAENRHFHCDHCGGDFWLAGAAGEPAGAAKDWKDEAVAEAERRWQAEVAAAEEAIPILERELGELMVQQYAVGMELARASRRRYWKTAAAIEAGLLLVCVVVGLVNWSFEAFMAAFILLLFPMGLLAAKTLDSRWMKEYAMNVQTEYQEPIRAKRAELAEVYMIVHPTAPPYVVDVKSGAEPFRNR